MDRTMAELCAGERGIVTALALSQARAAPLLRLGLLPGTEVLCIRRSPLGDPTAFRFRGTTVALRRMDTQRIAVQPTENAAESTRNEAESTRGSTAGGLKTLPPVWKKRVLRYRGWRNGA